MNLLLIIKLFAAKVGDIGVPPGPALMDYNAWFEVFLDGRWFTFDARHNTPRIGRITVARGRDATDIPLVTSFGPHILKTFRVWTDEVDAAHRRNSNAAAPECPGLAARPNDEFPRERGLGSSSGRKFFGQDFSDKQT